MEQGKVFNIQHFSVHDGPGIRTVVFLKGCPLRCKWCANPESQSIYSEFAWNKGECICCKNCVRCLKKYNFNFENEGFYFGLLWNEKEELLSEDETLVRRTCPTEALHVIGKQFTVEEVLEEVEKDSSFYASSGGGMTLSGGEPLLQHRFSIELLKEAGRRHIHRAIETTGFVQYEIFKSVCENLDYLLIDVKTFDEELHKANTGVSNKIILENLTKVRRDFPELQIKVRTPVIPSVNDSENEIRKISNFVHSLGTNTEYELLKYHRLGQPKYESLHLNYEMGLIELSEERYQELKKLSLQ